MSKHNMYAQLSGSQNDMPVSGDILENPAVGKHLAFGTTVPAGTTAGYAPSCIFQHNDGSAGGTLYVNEGSITSCDFKAVTTPSNIAAQIDTAFPVSGTAAGRGPSPLIWDTCPVLDYILDPTQGAVYFNDFIGENVVLANNQTVTNLGGGICGFTAATAGSTISMNADEPTGVVTLNSTTDDEDAGISILGGLNTAGQIVFAAGKQVWMEARVKSLNITDAKFGIFCGFAEEGLCATTALIGADDALTDKDYIGFHKLAADGDKFDTVYNKASGTTSPVTVKADAVTIAADTYKKIGLYYDGTTITFYADGVALADTLARTAADFPLGEEMAFYFVAMNAHGDTAESSIDWIRIAKEF